MPTIPAEHGSLTWIAISAIVVGGLVRSLKADALPAVLTRLFRPDGPPIAIPTRVLPWLALVGGGGLAFLESLREGASYDAAAKAAVMAAATAVLGHELLSGVPGTKKLLGGIILLFSLASGVSACALFTKENAPQTIDVIADKTTCALANLDEPFEKIVVRCFLTAEDIPRILPLFTAARESATRAGARWSEPIDAGVPIEAGTPDSGR